MTGSAAGDFIGFVVTVLANGDYVVGSPAWNGGRGAATRCSATTGCPATISSANSLVGSLANDGVGGAITALPNGNYLVRSSGWNNPAPATTDVGAITWCNGASTCTGTVSTANSLVGGSASDQVGLFDPVVLTNGNYVVPTLFWNGPGASFAGAVTLCSGTAPCLGTVTSANSLVGSRTGDVIGSEGIAPLPNGGYVVNSSSWASGPTPAVGAVTFCSASGCTGPISAANSLIGSVQEDRVGLLKTVVLTNGNYVVGSPLWDNGGIVNAGAATFCNGTTGCVGSITTGNSLVGETANDEVSGFGGGGIVALPNGNYVVSSFNWDNVVTGFSNVGAVTYCSGSSGCTGLIGTGNSLVGTSIADQVGQAAVTVLTNGNYVVGSPSWSNTSPVVTDAGAVTFCNGASGCIGAVSSGNSLVGSTIGAAIGNGRTALTNGNYVVLTPDWDNGGTSDVGAATFCSGTSGCTGTISAGNSLIGTTQGDSVGAGATALAGGGYTVQSGNWNNGAIASAGAVTWCGPSGRIGTVSSANSLVGSTENDYVGAFGETTALPNGDYIVRSPQWDNNGIMEAGALSLGLRNGGTVGPVTASNSVRGAIPDAGYYLNFSFGSSNNLLVVGRSLENIVTVFAQEAPGAALRITSIMRLANGRIVLQGLGMPDAVHTVERSLTTPASASFSFLASTMADGAGLLQFEDSTATGLSLGFYRLTFP